MNRYETQRLYYQSPIKKQNHHALFRMNARLAGNPENLEKTDRYWTIYAAEKVKKTDMNYSRESRILKIRQAELSADLMRKKWSDMKIKKDALSGVFACFALAVVLNLWSMWLLPLFAILYMVAFILSICAIAQRRIVWGIILLLSSFLFPIIVSGLKLGYESAQKKIKMVEDEKFKKELIQAVSEPTPASAQPRTSSGTQQPPVASLKDKPVTSMSRITDRPNIKGAFGINFGDVFKPTPDTNSDRLTNGEPIYRITAPVRFRHFNEYYVLITPTTSKIYEIWAVAKFEGSGDADAEQKVVEKIIEDKYQTKHNGFMMSRYEIDNVQIAINTPITFGGSALQIRYTDNLLREVAEKERIDSEIKKTNTEGI